MNLGTKLLRLMLICIVASFLTRSPKVQKLMFLFLFLIITDLTKRARSRDKERQGQRQRQRQRRQQANIQRRRSRDRELRFKLPLDASPFFMPSLGSNNNTTPTSVPTTEGAAERLYPRVSASQAVSLNSRF